MLGCHFLEQRIDPETDLKYFDFQVTVQKTRGNVSSIHEMSGNEIMEDYLIRDNGKRKYWNVTKGDQLEMKFKFFNNATERNVSLTCFAWCNEDMSDDPPLVKTIEPSSDTISPELATKLQDPETNTTDVIKPSVGKMAISPVSLYRISDPGVGNCSDDGICRQNFNFYWLDATNPCQSNFVCTVMNGAVCKTYGVVYSVTNNADVNISQQIVCEPNRLITDTVRFKSAANIELWYQNDFPDYDATCYFWCTENGDLPQAEEKAVFDFGLLLHLENKTHKSFPIEFDQSLNKSYGLSPALMYNLTIKPHHDNSTSDTNLQISNQIELIWREPTECLSKLICSKLDGNICADHGFRMTIFNKNATIDASKNVCRIGQVFEQWLKPGFKIQLEHWHSNDNIGGSNDIINDIRCFIWCTAHGKPPERPPALVDFTQRLNTFITKGYYESKELILTDNSNLIKLSMSPTSFYHLSLTNETACNKNVISTNKNDSFVDKNVTQMTSCHFSVDMSQYRDDKCRFFVVCPILEGNSCGDFKLSLGFQSSNGVLCYDNTVFTGPELYFNQTINVDFEWRQRNGFEVSCYLWCSSKGQLPVPKPPRIDSFEILNSVAENRNQNFLGGDSTIENLSPVSLYVLEPTADGLIEKNCSKQLRNWCVEDHILNWRNNFPCTVNSLCTEITGEQVCGNFGLTIVGQESGESSEICFEHELYSKDVNKGENTELRIWWLPGSTFKMTCFLWCSAESVEENESSYLNEDTAQALADQSRKFTTSNWTEETATSVLSPIKIERVNFSSDRAFELCGNETDCLLKQTFQWHGNQDCEWRFICRHLGGNTCGDYTITINEIKPVCREDRMESGSLSTSETFNLTLDFEVGSNFEIECYFWCTKDGLVPDPLPTDKLQSHPITEHVNSSSEIEPVLLSGVKNQSESSKAISPVKVYQLVNPDSNQTGCGSETKKCQAQLNMTWLGEEPCLFSLICDSLSGNICGNYALSLDHISFEDNTSISMDVCYQGLLYEHWIKPFDQLKIKFWNIYQDKDHENMNCYFWCHSSDSKKNSLENQSAEMDTTYGNVSKINGDTGFEIMSPIPIWTNFRIDNNMTSLGCNNSKSCSVSYRFNWQGQGGCDASFDCDQLEDSICNDLTVKLEFTGRIKKAYQPVCRSGQLNLGIIPSGEHLTISVWFLEASIYQSTCYLWCSNRGVIPDQWMKTTETSKLVENLSNGVISTKHPRPETTVEVSPSFVYLLTNYPSCQEKDCTYKFFCNNLDPCQVRFMCTIVEGSICRNHLININFGKIDQSEDVCYNGAIHEGTLLQNSTAELKIRQFSSDQKFESIKCYFWCTTDGSTVQTKGNTNDEIVQEIVNGTSDLVLLDFNSTSTKTLSPLTIYHILLTRENTAKCNERRCQVKSTLVWKNPRPGVFKTICTVLDGNPCADYMLSISFTDKEKGREFKESICKTGQTETDVVVKFEEKIQIQIWQTNLTSDFSISCYFWASKNGNFPKPRVAMKEKKLTNMLYNNEKLQSTEISLSNMKDLTLSLGGVYYLKDDFDSLPCKNSESFCFTTMTMQFLAPKSCQFRIICDTLDGHLCSDFGLELDSQQFGSRQEICQTQVLYGSVVNSSNLVEINFWNSDATIPFEIGCHFWCTRDGQIPQNPAITDPKLHKLLNKILASSYLLQKTPIFEQAFQIMSSATVYTLDLAKVQSSKPCPDKNSTCSVHLELWWLESSHCDTGFMCQNIEGQFCGDFGLELTLRQGQYSKRSTDYCHQNSIFQMKLDENSVVDFHLWFKRSVLMKGFCQFWCLKQLTP